MLVDTRMARYTRHAAIDQSAVQALNDMWCVLSDAGRKLAGGDVQIKRAEQAPCCSEAVFEAIESFA